MERMCHWCSRDCVHNSTYAEAVLYPVCCLEPYHSNQMGPEYPPPHRYEKDCVSKGTSPFYTRIVRMELGFRLAVVASSSLPRMTGSCLPEGLFLGSLHPSTGCDCLSSASRQVRIPKLTRYCQTEDPRSHLTSFKMCQCLLTWNPAKVQKQMPDYIGILRSSRE